MNHRISLVVVLLFVTIARADIIGMPFQQMAVSSDSEYVARVDFGGWIEAEKRKLPDWISIHRYDREARQYIKVREFQYGINPGSGFLFISNGGKHVIGVNVAPWTDRPMGLRIYDSSGTLVKVWRVADFLTTEEVDGCPMTGSTTQWFGSGAFSYDGQTFEFIGPATRIVGGRGSFTVMRGAKEGLSFRFTIDLKTLELKRE